MAAISKRLRRWLLLGHRWLGITTGLLFALWIGSGLVMLFVPFPSLTRAERLATLPPLAWDRVSLAPDAALAAARIEGVPPAFSLEMRGDEPVYRIAAPDGRRVTVSAQRGALLGPVAAEEALRIAGGVRAEPVRRDQWTVTARYDPLRPFFKVALGDAAGTEVYVSEPTGEIALDTTRAERAWNWVGAVTHWIYLTPLRARVEAWRQVVLWISGIASIGALTGLVIGIWRLRLRRRYRGGAVSPYRGLALWHHAFGLAGGIGLAGFIVSGWLSMNPNRWFSSHAPPAAFRTAYAGQPGPLRMSAADVVRLSRPDAHLVRFLPIGGRWWISDERTEGPVLTALNGSAGPDKAFLSAAAADAVPGGHLTEARRLGDYDSYWSARDGKRPLPVLRLVYDDPDATWLHIDPRDGTILDRLDRSGRAYRWLFDAPHRLDIPGLDARMTAQWVLNLLAAGIALTGLIAGWRRLSR